MRARITLTDGTVVPHGQFHDFPEFHDAQRAFVPVVMVKDGHLVGCGTAVCIGAGWFLTARHILTDYDSSRKAGEPSELYIIFETDTPLAPDDPHSVLGGALPVLGYELHPEVDLATMSVQLPLSLVPELRKAELSLRLPATGEPISAVGYPEMASDTQLPASGPAAVDWARTLRASVGIVLGQQLERRGLGVRGSPGFETDAPAFAGMSGGPVLDSQNRVVGFVSSSTPPDGDFSGFSSYVALLGPALELSVLDLTPGSEPDASGADAVQLPHLVSAGAIDVTDDDNFAVDPVTGKAFYVAR